MEKRFREMQSRLDYLKWSETIRPGRNFRDWSFASKWSFAVQFFNKE